MINLVTGLPGSGKTLWTLSTVKKYVEAENKLMIEQGKEIRQVFYHGIPQLTLDWQLLDNPENWPDLPSGSIVIIDECQTTFRPRANGSNVPKYISEFETHRHKGLDFFLLTQHPALIDQNIRRLAGKHYHVIRFYGFQKSTIHEFQSVRMDVDKSQKNSIATHFVYPKEVFSWYKSADLHTMKKRIPMRIYMVVLLPILMIAALYYFVQTAGHLTPDNPENALPTQTPTNTVKPSQSTPNNIIQASNTQATIDDYITYNKPRNINFPYSAPKYDELTQPITAPYPAACVVIRTKCQCYTQQATKIKTTDAFCREVVENGFFLDFQASPKANNPQLTQAPQTEKATAL